MTISDDTVTLVSLTALIGVLSWICKNVMDIKEHQAVMTDRFEKLSCIAGKQLPMDCPSKPKRNWKKHFILSLMWVSFSVSILYVFRAFAQ